MDETIAELLRRHWQLRERLEAFLTVDESSLETSAQTYFKPDTPLAQTWQYLRQQVRAKLDLNERIYRNGLFSPEEQQFLADWAQQWEKAWHYLAQLAYNNRIDLTAEGFFKSESFGVIKDGKLSDPTSRIFYYYTYSAAASDVEIDVLTGEFTVRRTDLVYDAGMSLNEQIDFGQIKGAFIQGIGNVTTRITLKLIYFLLSWSK